MSRPTLIIEEEEVSFKEFLEPYRNQEYISVNIVNKLITNAFLSSQILHEYTSFHKILKIKRDEVVKSKRVVTAERCILKFFKTCFLAKYIDSHFS